MALIVTGLAAFTDTGTPLAESEQCLAGPLRNLPM